LNIPKADILGFSNGGSTALQVAIRHPERVNKLVAVSAIYKRDGMIPSFWPSIQTATFDKDMPQPYKDAFLHVNPDRAKLLTMFERDRHRMATFKDWNAADINSIQAPTLVAVTDQDVVRAEHAVEMAHLLPHGRLVIFPGVHGELLGEVMSPHPNSRAPEFFAALVEEFLASP
jgi:pimeloyl-ACP methyl ester carboxylesterase